MDFPLRQKKLRENLTTARFDALLVSHLPNIRYLCGFTGSAGLLFIDEADKVFFTDGRYSVQAREQVKGAKVIIGRKSALRAFAEWMSGRRKKVGAIGIESDHMTVAEKKRLAALLPGGHRLRDSAAPDSPGLVERARMVKDSDELASVRAAVRLGATLFDRALEVLRPGVTESEVAAEMEYAARKAGASEMSFPTIIASGARSALPHGRATQQPIRAGGFVVCDFGVILEGYCSDQTRTVWVGSGFNAASDEARYAYDSVRDAQAAAIEAARPGVRVEELDEAARHVLRKAGLARYFTHSTGHGVGLEIHEGPRVAAGEKEILRPGTVITIEPGVYLPGKWGVRIEDMIVVNETGCEVLTPTSKDFLAV